MEPAERKLKTDIVIIQPTFAIRCSSHIDEVEKTNHEGDYHDQEKLKGKRKTSTIPAKQAVLQSLMTQRQLAR
jgi:hypothetical protein